MKKRRQTAKRRLSGYGFDYGVGITAMAVGSIEFNNNLIDAEIVGVAYGLDYSRLLGMQVPAITLVGRNEEPLRKAFEEFSNWAEWTDADAIELTIVLRKGGGYQLCINPEVGALYKRSLQYDTVANSMAVQLTWIKGIDTTSQPLIDLRAVLSAGIVRPFLLRAACYSGILLGNRPPIPELLQPVSHRRELLKFEIRFVDEGSKDHPHWQRIALGKETLDGEASVTSHKIPKPIPKPVVWTHRTEALKRLFPVTLWASESSENCLELRCAAETLGLRGWQMDQAICNLVLSQEITDGKLHFQGIQKRDWPDRLWKTLRNRFEVSGADQQCIQRLTVDSVVDQAILDARILLKHYGVKRPPKELERLQHLLRQHSLDRGQEE